VVCKSQLEIRSANDSYSLATDPFLFPAFIPIDGRFLLNLVAGYFDESTDADSEGFCYTVAGFVADQEAAVILELKWRDLLREYHLGYFKASELNAGEGQFKKFRDEPNAKEWKPFSAREKTIFNEIKKRFTDIIVECRGLHGIGATVVIPDYEQILKTDARAKGNLPLPYFLCQGMVLMHAGLIMNVTNTRRPHGKAYLRPIFDSHEIYSGQAKIGFDDFCAKNPIPAEYLLPMHYESETDYLTLQAADNLAFEVRKVLFNEANKPDLCERISLTRIKEQSDSILQVYKFGYSALKAFIDLQVSGRKAFPELELSVDASLWELRNIFYEM